MALYTDIYGISIYQGQKHGRLPKTNKIWFIIYEKKW